MIITESENGDSKAPTIPSEGSVDEPQSPPPYSPSAAFSSTSDRKPLPTPPQSPPSSTGPGPTPPADIPPPCNYLLQRRSNESIKGVWHVDTAMSIPDTLLAPLEDFDGAWNETDAKARKERKKLEKKGKRRSEDSPLPSTTRDIRPNLMLQSKNGSINADVHVVSSDGAARPALIVAEGHNGSVTLQVASTIYFRDYALQPIQIHATSQNGAVRVSIPQSFEGALITHTKNGSLKFSDPIKARLSVFSASETTRGYIGDWQSAGFGAPATSSDPNADPPIPSFADPFSTWTGPLVHISSHNGSVHLSYVDEEPPTNTTERGGIRDFMSNLFGGNQSRGTNAPRPPWGDGAPWGDSKYPWGNGAPWGDTKYPWGNGAPWENGPGAPFVPGQLAPGGPFGVGAGPFGHGGPFSRGGPFGRGGSCGRGRSFSAGGGPSGWGGGWGCSSSRARGGGCGSSSRFWGGGRVGGNKPSDEKAQDDWFLSVDLDENGIPLDRKK